jgi:hypothetical protein
MIEQYKPAIKQGAIMAAVGIIIFLILYAIDPLIYAKPTGWMIMFAVNLIALPVTFMILGTKACKRNFEIFSFGKAFNAAFFTGLTAAVLTLVFNLVFINLIDTTWEAEMAEEVLNSTEAFMEKMGAPQEAIDKAMDDARAKGATKPKGFIGQLQSTGGGLFWYALVALAIGGVQRTKKSELQNEVEDTGN